MVRRRTQGTEQRLHGRMSIGLGGHVGPEDGDIGDPKLLRRGLLRELREELALPPGPLEPRFVGWINDDSNPVGEVHVGLAFHLELPTDPGRAGAELVKIREISKLEGGLVPLVGRDSPWQNLCHLETWSRILIEAWFAPPCRTAEPPTSHESEQGTRTD